MVRAAALMAVFLIGAGGASAQTLTEDDKAFYASIQQSDWSYDGASAGNDVVLLRKPAPEGPEYPRAWARYELRNPADLANTYPVFKYYASVSLVDVDCAEHRSREIQSSYFARRNMVGDGMAVHKVRDWEYPMPGSVGEQVVLKTCAAVPAAPAKRPKKRR